MSQTLPTASPHFIYRGSARSRPHQALRTVLQPPDEASLIARIKELIEQHPTSGYRRMWARLRFGDQRLVNK